MLPEVVGLGMEPGSLGTGRNQDTEMVDLLELRDEVGPSGDQVVEVYSPRSQLGVVGSHCLVAEDRTEGTLVAVRTVDSPEVHPAGVRIHQEVRDAAGSQLQLEGVG